MNYRYSSYVLLLSCTFEVEPSEYQSTKRQKRSQHLQTDPKMLTIAHIFFLFLPGNVGVIQSTG
ncbi:MAG: hypothetical protein ACHBN1_16445 [Heteroscytonema crispum UTEX LB 1556]